MGNVIEKIKMVRQREIEEGKNLATSFPLYIVYDEIKSYHEGDSDYDVTTSLFSNNRDTYCYAYSYDGDGVELTEQEYEDYTPTEDDPPKEKFECVRVGYHDRFITCCFTWEAAEIFIENERHNLTKPRIYVAHIPWRNVQLREIAKLLGDKN